MEKSKTNLLQTNQSTRLFSAERHLSSTSTRKRLMEQALDKERTQPRPTSLINKSSSKFPKNLEKNSTVTLKSLKEALPKKPVTKLNLKALNEVKKPMTRSRSPACVKRNNSLEVSKSRIPRDRSVDKVKNTGKIPTKPNQNTLNMTKVVNQFSIQKINELKNLNIQGNEELGKTLVLLLKDADCIREHNSGLTEAFLEFLNSPGIAVKTLKRVPMYLSTGRITDKNISSAFECYNKIDCVSNTSGHLLLASLFDTIFKYKNFPIKCIRFLYPSEISYYKQEKLNKTMVSHATEKKTHAKTESLTVPLIVPKIEISFEDSLDHLNSVKIEDSFEVRDSFRDSKKILLDRFINKMINPIKFEEIIQEKNPLVEVKNLNLDSLLPESGLRSKNSYRPSSTTPRPDSRLDYKNIDGILGKAKEIKAKHEEQKRKNFMVGTRFYKKIDEKFIKTLVEKMKKDSKELQKLKLKNFEEYSKKKSEYIELNKNLWINETLKQLQESEDLAQNNENEVLQELKYSALMDYLVQEKTINCLVTRAEQLESSYRKL